MKKFKFLAIAILAICLASCGGKSDSDSATNEDATKTETTETVEETAAPTADDFSSPDDIKAALEEATKAGDESKVQELMRLWEEKIAELKDAGDETALKAYVNALDAYYSLNKAALEKYGVTASAVTNSLNAIKALDAVAGGEMDKAVKDVQAEMDKAAKDAQDEMDKAMREAQAEMEKAMSGL